MKIKLLFLLLFTTGYIGAQQEVYNKVSLLLKNSSPNLILENKLLVINFVSNTENSNKGVAIDIEKTANVYEHAKLKGGKKGVVCVSIVANVSEEITLNKEGYQKTMKLLKAELGDIDVAGIENITFNSNGEVVYKNITALKIYESVQKLIIR